MKRAAIVYHFFPHYREGIIRALNSSAEWRYVWLGADVAEFQGIRAAQAWKQGDHVIAPFVSRGNVLWQWRVVAYSLTAKCDAFIFLANPYYLSTWFATLVCKLRGKRVLFWTHGWIADDGAIKGTVRDMFLRLADGILLYGHRARSIGIRKGFEPDKLHVIYNSLDYDRQRAVREGLVRESIGDVRRRVASRYGIHPEGTVAVCTARLIAACRFDLLILALGMLRERAGRHINLVLVGDGPERAALEKLARTQQVDVVFTGAIYDEQTLGELIYAADMTVSPGKVGLTAIHSLMYGTPVITHDRLDRQFPEVEAIRPGTTGAFFHDVDVESLARVIDDWIGRHPKKTATTIEECFREVDELYNPRVQRELIERALDGEPANDGRVRQ